MKKIKDFFLNNYILLAVLLLVLSVVILPFIFSNNLEGFDTAGHVSSVYFIKNNFWPWPDGWNFNFLAGYPQGFFYPSFFHWLTAALSFILPIDLSFKLVVSLAVFGFIYLFYLLAAKVLANKKIANPALLIVCFFYLLETGLSDNMFSDIFYGMVAHLFSLTLLIAFVYSLYNSLSKNKYNFLPGLLLALNILTHVLTGGMAILLTGILLFFSRGKNYFKLILNNLIIAMLLTSCWWLPFLLNFKYVSGSSMSAPLMPIIILFIPLIVLISIINLIRFKKNNNILIASLASFNIIILLLYSASLFWSSDELPMHFYRLLIYPFIFFPLNLIYLFKDIKLNWTRISLISLLFLIYFFLFFRIVPVGPFPVKLLDGLNNFYESGRIIATGNSRNMDARFHSTRMKIVEQYNLPIFEGLFVESASNGRFIMSLLNSWSDLGENFVWAYNNLARVDNLEWGAKVFGINYEYNINDNSPENEKNNLLLYKEIKYSNDLKKSEKDIIFQQQKMDFKLNRQILLDDSSLIDFFRGGGDSFYYQTFYKTGDNYLAETLNFRPVTIDNNWTDYSFKWWGTDWLKTDDELVYDKPVLIWQKETDDWNLTAEQVGLKIDFHSENKTMDLFTVQANQFSSPVPIYVKVSYFPFWHAYNENGEELEIYKASPNFMLVYGNGEIIFKYEKPWYYYAAYTVSFLSFVLILCNYWVKTIRNKLKEKRVKDVNI